MTTTLSLVAKDFAKLVEPLINTDMSTADTYALFCRTIDRREVQADAIKTTRVPFIVALAETSLTNASLSERVLVELNRKGIDIDAIHDHDFGGYVESKTLLHCALVHGTPEFVALILRTGGDPLQRQLTAMWRATPTGREKDTLSMKDAFELVSPRDSDSEDTKTHKLRMRTILQSWNARGQAHRILDEIEKGPGP